MYHVLTFGALVCLDDSTILSVLIETVCFARSWCLLCLALRGYLKNLVYCLTLEFKGKNVQMWKYGNVKVTLFLASSLFKSHYTRNLSCNIPFPFRSRNSLFIFRLLYKKYKIHLLWQEFCFKYKITEKFEKRKIEKM